MAATGAAIVLSRLPADSAGAQPLLPQRCAQERETRRRGIGRGRAPFHQIVDLAQIVVADRAAIPFVMGARAMNNSVRRLIARRLFDRRLSPVACSLMLEASLPV